MTAMVLDDGSGGNRTVTVMKSRLGVLTLAKGVATLVPLGDGLQRSRTDLGDDGRKLFDTARPHGLL